MVHNEDIKEMDSNRGRTMDSRIVEINRGSIREEIKGIITLGTRIRLQRVKLPEVRARQMEDQVEELITLHLPGNFML